jgi:hypothetical protein
MNFRHVENDLEYILYMVGLSASASFTCWVGVLEQFAASVGDGAAARLWTGLVLQVSLDAPSGRVDYCTK